MINSNCAMQSLTVLMPQAPGLSLTGILQRPGPGSDQVVTYHRKDAAGDFQDLFSIPMRRAGLSANFDSVTHELQEESFQSINGMWLPPWSVESRVAEHLPYSPRGGSLVRKLTANWADLDFYKRDEESGRDALAWDYVYGELMRLQAEGAIPPISVIMDSGRGMWVLWLDRQVDANVPVDAYPDKVEAWSDIQRAIHEKLAYLGSDCSAIDPSRVFRVLGSVNVKCERPKRVCCHVFSDKSATVPAYTLKDLQVEFAVPMQRRCYSSRKNPSASPEARSRGLLGALGRWELDLRRIDILEKMRGGFQVGTRNWAIFISSRICFGIWKSVQRIREAGLEDRLDTVRYSKLANMSLDDFQLKVQSFADRCEHSQDYRPEEIVAKAMMAVSNPLFRGSISHEKISKVLHVSLHEAAWLNESVRTRTGSGWQPESGSQIPLAMSRHQKQEERRRALKGLVSGCHQGLPTLVECVALLRDMKIKTSTFTVQSDLKAMGIRTGREHKVLRAAG